ncbi:heavy metal-binding domain-containing protein [Aeromonas hydrophila]|uniref:Heavy metal-binding domain-containing protein n=1 Tax=Aeromonas hydrophila TaxID=644 RepID=A0A926FNL0_AERHY|nr:heavy metal-binding domain-containing protein [Aeromonas hydrophila]
MILSTTPTLEGKTIREYRGIVVGEAILGANVFRICSQASATSSAAAPVPMKRAGRAGNRLRRAQGARRGTGANAVVGIDIDYEVVGQSGSMLMVSISGTAVLV